MRLFSAIQPRRMVLKGNRRLFFGCLLLFLFSAAISFWYAFPAEVLQRYLVQELSGQSKLRVAGSDAEVIFPFGLQLNLEVETGVAEINDPVMIRNLRLTPAWGRLLTGSFLVDMQGLLADGNFSGQLNRSGQLQLEFTAIDLAELQAQDSAYRLEGQLSGSLEISDLESLLGGRGQFSLQLDNGFLRGLNRLGLPEKLPIGTVQLAGQFYQQRLSIEKAVMFGGAAEISGGGTLLAADTAGQTRLNLNLRLKPTAQTPESARSLLDVSGVKPTADGSYLLRIGGSLARPVVR